MTVPVGGGGRGLGVELAGIPGSGKSRRARALATRLTERGVVVTQPQARFAPSVPTARRVARKVRAVAGAAAGAPVATARLVGGVLRSAQPGPGDLAGRVVQVTVAQRVAARAAGETGVALVDEGLVQALWSIGLRGDVEPVLAALDAGPRRPTADLLVVVRVPPELALDRLAHRSSRHSRTQLLDERERLAELARGARLLDRLVEWWSGRAPGSCEVLTLDGSADDGADHAALVDRICDRTTAGTPG
ncbi:thymidylate kinase [Geodermatophilus bullaregiensis]|uniref:AAA family ATPase n=1 Tax=Geodermatophilus bullaregiensis TaxID=1564160 RepID=UPI001958989B|nr:AAA family ATPase [Geodermatophilus bullaregiensis]MBM7808966.1 thymidylate kinase [Geodermatophilus bullaregiensis]